MTPGNVVSAALALGMVHALCACEGDVSTACATADSGAGLRPIAHRHVNEEDLTYGHAREIVVDGDLVFVADSNGVPVFRWNHESETLELLQRVDSGRSSHCSTLALHEASRTLVCAATDHGLFGLVDVRDPEEPAPRPWPFADGERGPTSVPDVAIVGDTVWMAGNERGLLRTTLSGGAPGPIESMGIGTRVMQVELTNERLVLLDRADGLVVLDATTLERLGSAEIAGPPIDLAVDGDRVVVSLGSEGAQVFELSPSGTPERVASVQPRCVATAADLSGDQLAVACYSGITLYDLSGPAPRVAGFAPARHGMLDVAFASFGLVATDWYRVSVFAVDPDGAVVLPDVPRGLALAYGADVRVPVRNPGETPLTVGWALRAARRADSQSRTGLLTLPPLGHAILELSRSDLEGAGSLGDGADLVFFPEREGASSCNTTHTRLWHRTETDEPARGRVGIGHHFPTLRRTVDGPGPEALPLPDVENLIVFLKIDCFLQWAQLEDMAWAQDHGTGQPPPVLLYLSSADQDPFDQSFLLRQFDADRLLMVEWADYYHSVPDNEDAANPESSFNETFFVDRDGGDFPWDYFVDADGVVRDTSRHPPGRWRLLGD